MARNLDRVGGVSQAAANAGTLINRKNIRFLDGGGITWSATDDPANDEVEVTAAAGGSSLPSGSMVSFGGTSAPSGWLECNGAAVSRATYSALFAAISTAWGSGDGFTTFNVPSLARRTLVGRGGAGTGTLGNVVGNVGGAETHTLISAESANHTHSDPGHSHNISIHGDQVCAPALPAIQGTSYVAVNNGGAPGTIISALNKTIYSANAGLLSSGGGGAHNNVQPSAIVMMIIKT